MRESVPLNFVRNQQSYTSATPPVIIGSVIKSTPPTPQWRPSIFPLPLMPYDEWTLAEAEAEEEEEAWKLETSDRGKNPPCFFILGQFLGTIFTRQVD